MHIKYIFLKIQKMNNIKIPSHGLCEECNETFYLSDLDIALPYDFWKYGYYKYWICPLCENGGDIYEL